MAKFKVGDRVRWVTNFRRNDGSIRTVCEIDGSNIWYHTTDTNLAPGKYRADEDDLELDEHPALTLAKAEVVRLDSMPLDDMGFLGQGMLYAYKKILKSFGLEYRAKPVVPQPVEYDFFPIEPLRQES